MGDESESTVCSRMKAKFAGVGECARVESTPAKCRDRRVLEELGWALVSLVQAEDLTVVDVQEGPISTQRPVSGEIPFRFDPVRLPADSVSVERRPVLLQHTQDEHPVCGAYSPVPDDVSVVNPGVDDGACLALASPHLPHLPHCIERVAHGNRGTEPGRDKRCRFSLQGLEVELRRACGRDPENRLSIGCEPVRVFTVLELDSRELSAAARQDPQRVMMGENGSTGGHHDFVESSAALEPEVLAVSLDREGVEAVALGGRLRGC